MLGVPDEVRIIFGEELRRSTRRLAYVIITLLVPTLLLLVLAAVLIIRGIVDAREEEEPKPTGLVSLSHEVVFPAEALPEFVVFGSRQSGMDALVGASVKELYVLPEDYLDSGRVEWFHGGGDFFSGFDPGPGEAVSATINALLRVALAGRDMPPGLLERALVPAIFEQVRIGEDGLPVEEDKAAEVARFFVSFGSAILLLIVIAMGASSLVQTVAEEKESRMIEVLLTSARPLSVMAGKVLAVGVAGLIQMVVWVGSFLLILPLVFDVIPDAPDFPVDPSTLIWVVAFFLAGYFVSAVIMAGVGAATSGVRETAQIAGLVIMPLVVPIYALVPLLSNPDGILARTFSFIPFTAPTAMMLRLGVADPPLLEVLASLTVTVLAGLGLLWASARVFRAGLLLYGQRMGVRRIVAALREAG